MRVDAITEALQSWVRTVSSNKEHRHESWLPGSMRLGRQVWPDAVMAGLTPTTVWYCDCNDCSARRKYWSDPVRPTNRSHAVVTVKRTSRS